jgi:hypothetical protein
VPFRVELLLHASTRQRTGGRCAGTARRTGARRRWSGAEFSARGLRAASYRAVMDYGSLAAALVDSWQWLTGLEQPGEAPRVESWAARGARCKLQAAGGHASLQVRSEQCNSPGQEAQRANHGAAGGVGGGVLEGQWSWSWSCICTNNTRSPPTTKEPQSSQSQVANNQQQ